MNAWLADAQQMSSLWSIIAGSGPVAAVLFVAVGALWRDNRELRDKLEEQRREQIAFMTKLLDELE